MGPLLLLRWLQWCGSRSTSISSDSMATSAASYLIPQQNTEMFLTVLLL